MNKEFIFVEKYAPKSVDECILPETIKKYFVNIRDSGTVPHMTLSGPPGIGKTSTIQALAHELGRDFMKINGSKERSIDTIRTKVENFASTVSLSLTGKKILLIDEADNLTSDAQMALKALIEDVQRNCTFVFTCNYKNRLDSALLSRCPIIEFSIPLKEKPKLASIFYDRILEILTIERIEYDDKKTIMKLLMKHFPDFRRTLHEIQRHSLGGTIDSSILANATDIKISELIKFMKDKEFNKVRSWVINNLDNDPNIILRRLYDGLSEYAVPHTIPEAILIIAEHQSKSVVDNEINLIACFVKIMCKVEFT